MERSGARRTGVAVEPDVLDHCCGGCEVVVICEYGEGDGQGLNERKRGWSLMVRGSKGRRVGPAPFRSGRVGIELARPSPLQRQARGSTGSAYGRPLYLGPGRMRGRRRPVYRAGQQMPSSAACPIRRGGLLVGRGTEARASSSCPGKSARSWAARAGRPPRRPESPSELQECACQDRTWRPGSVDIC
jgi:hypothetical protein